MVVLLSEMVTLALQTCQGYSCSDCHFLYFNKPQAFALGN
jgi:hypothetical protein